MNVSVTVRYEVDGQVFTFTAEREVPDVSGEAYGLVVGGLGLTLYLEAAAMASEAMLEEHR